MIHYRGLCEICYYSDNCNNAENDIKFCKNFIDKYYIEDDEKGELKNGKY